MNDVTYPNRHFGRRLQRAVAEAIWRGDYGTQSELAYTYGYSNQQLSNYIHGRSLPDDLALEALVPDAQELIAQDRLDKWAMSHHYSSTLLRRLLARRIGNLPACGTT